MPTFSLMQVDAFTDRPLAGNPCAVVFDADPLDPDTMQAIAREMNLSETAFVQTTERADVRARYFTPAEEIPLAGHPTIATMFALVDTGRLSLDGRSTTVRLELPAGILSIDLESQPDGSLQIVMAQRPPEFGKTYAADEVLPVFGLSEDDAPSGVPVQTVSTGTPQLMIPVRDLDALRRAQLNVAAYRALRERGDFFSPHLFCLEGVTDDGDTFARHFGVPPDVMEDPFTGSATGGMAAYLWRHRLIDGPAFVAQQGHWMNRPGRATVEVVGPPEAIETVKVGGTAVPVLRGEMTV